MSAPGPPADDSGRPADGPHRPGGTGPTVSNTDRERPTATRRAAVAAAVPALTAVTGSVAPRRRRGGAGGDGSAAGDARLGFVGDVMLGRSVDERWRDRPPAGVWGDTLDRLRSLDGLFCNLECCLADRGRPRPGRTYHFRADPDWAVPALSAAGATWVSLANNHVLDFGRTALADTRETLDAEGIAHAGAGPDRAAATAPALVEAGDLSVAVVAFTDRSPSYAAVPGRPGTAYAPLTGGNPLARVAAGNALERALALDPDLLVASLHWGPNWAVEPTAGRRAFARWLVDRGVDVVHGHSAHVVQGVEVYEGRPILYDCGDYVDDYVVKPDLRNDRGARFEVAIADGRPESVRVAPVEIAHERVESADESVAAWVRRAVRERSAPFGTAFRRDGRALVVPLSG